MQYITLRNLQQFLYCPKRWGLMELNCDWASNAFVAMGDIIHKRVDNPSLTSVIGNKIIERAVPVSHNEYGLIGKIDQLELIRSDEGVFVSKYNDKFILNIVEFKKSKPKNCEYNSEDAVQVYAQKLCVDEMFGSDCGTYIFYGDTKRRIKIICNKSIKDLFFNAYNGIINALANNTIPDMKDKQYCSGCSMNFICLTNCYKNKKRFKDYILKLNEKIT